MVTPSLILTKASVSVTIAKKHRNDGTARDRSIARFFEQVLNSLVTNVDLKQIKVILVCSPSNVRQEFMDYVKSQAQKTDGNTTSVQCAHIAQEQMSKFMLIRVNTATSAGLREALSDVNVSTRMQTTKCADDIRVWDSFQAMLNHNPDRCVYTPQFVYKAALGGAIKSLMISDVVFRDENPIVRYFFLALVHFVRHNGAGPKTSVHVFSSAHVTGEQLAQLGNVAALLHFDCP
uniref:Protein pelota n=1 Tax=Lygus hesperus TaxID=30085 RepID=A0A0A9XCP6_LYGHE